MCIVVVTIIVVFALGCSRSPIIYEAAKIHWGSVVLSNSCSQTFVVRRPWSETGVLFGASSHQTYRILQKPSDGFL
jgi:hypothetical protein